MRRKNRSYELILHKDNGIKLVKRCGRNERIVRKGHAGRWR
jgi:hypothetical protein